MPWSRRIAVADDAALWLADLDAAEAGEPALSVLSTDERERAARFVFDQHRRRFIACRAWLRTLLGEALGQPPSALTFEYGPSGKPALRGSPLRFNLSHSDRYGLAAITGPVEVGVDIEQVRPMADMDGVAERVFSPGERAALARVPDERKAEAFFAAWTRKEAYIKARGEHLAVLGSVEVTLTPGEPPRLVGVAGRPGEAQRWSIEALSPVPGFAAAVCLEGPSRIWNSL